MHPEKKSCTLCKAQRKKTMENPAEIKRSWNLQTNWQTGPKVLNKLLPPVFGRIAVPFVSTWREQAQPTLVGRPKFQ